MANNAEKNFHPAAYINFRKDEVFSRWVAVWFDFHPQLLPRSFSPSLFCVGFKLFHYIPFSESICFLKTLSNYWSLEIQKYLQFLILMNFHYLCIVMDAKRERKKKETHFSPAFCVLLSYCCIHCFDCFMCWQTFKNAIGDF